MKIISHRGYWKTQCERNADSAFHRSFSLGYGTETDLRDLNGRIVVSHDPPTESQGPMDFETLLEIHSMYGGNLTLALNIKSDGLQEKIASALSKYNCDSYALFDMAVPDLVQSVRRKLKCLTRQSDLERSPVLYDQAIGVWIDQFHSEWLSKDILIEHIKNGKEIYVVSPELHGRDPKETWRWYSSLDESVKGRITICTDIPEEASSYFIG